MKDFFLKLNNIEHQIDQFFIQHFEYIIGSFIILSIFHYFISKYIRKKRSYEKLWNKQKKKKKRKI